MLVYLVTELCVGTYRVEIASLGVFLSMVRDRRDAERSAIGTHPNYIRVAELIKYLLSGELTYITVEVNILKPFVPVY